MEGASPHTSFSSKRITVFYMEHPPVVNYTYPFLLAAWQPHSASVFLPLHLASHYVAAGSAPDAPAPAPVLEHYSQNPTLLECHPCSVAVTFSIRMPTVISLVKISRQAAELLQVPARRLRASVDAVDLSARKAYAALLQYRPPMGVQPAYLICSRL